MQNSFINALFKEILNAHIAKTVADQAIQKAMTSSQVEVKKEQK